MIVITAMMMIIMMTMMMTVMMIMMMMAMMMKMMIMMITRSCKAGVLNLIAPVCDGVSFIGQQQGVYNMQIVL